VQTKVSVRRTVECRCGEPYTLFCIVQVSC